MIIKSESNFFLDFFFLLNMHSSTMINICFRIQFSSLRSPAIISVRIHRRQVVGVAVAILIFYFHLLTGRSLAVLPKRNAKSKNANNRRDDADDKNSRQRNQDVVAKRVAVLLRQNCGLVELEDGQPRVGVRLGEVEPVDGAQAQVELQALVRLDESRRDRLVVEDDVVEIRVRRAGQLDVDALHVDVEEHGLGDGGEDPVGRQALAGGRVLARRRRLQARVRDVVGRVGRQLRLVVEKRQVEAVVLDGNLFVDAAPGVDERDRAADVGDVRVELARLVHHDEGRVHGRVCAADLVCLGRAPVRQRCLAVVHGVRAERLARHGRLRLGRLRARVDAVRADLARVGGVGVEGDDGVDAEEPELLEHRLLVPVHEIEDGAVLEEAVDLGVADRVHHDPLEAHRRALLHRDEDARARRADDVVLVGHDALLGHEEILDERLVLDRAVGEPPRLVLGAPLDVLVGVRALDVVVRRRAVVLDVVGVLEVEEVIDVLDDDVLGGAVAPRLVESGGGGFEGKRLFDLLVDDVREESEAENSNDKNDKEDLKRNGTTRLFGTAATSWNLGIFGRHFIIIIFFFGGKITLEKKNENKIGQI
jgi:hypothetical protein